MANYKTDRRIVLTLDAGGTNMVFGAMRGGEFIVNPLTLPSNAHNLVKATVAALCELRDARSVAQARGISMNKVFNG